MKKILFYLVCIILLHSHLLAKQKVAVIRLWPLPPVIAFWSDLELIYIPKASLTAMNNSLVSKYRPQYKQARVGNSENLEEMLALNANLYICPISNIKLCDGLKRANLNVITLTTNINNHNSKDTLNHWLVEIGKYTDIADKNKRLIDKITRIEKQIHKKTKDAKKPKVLIVHRIDKDNVSSGLFGDYLIRHSGGDNPLGYRTNSKVSLEEVYRINPDIIYISNFTPLMPNELMNLKEWQNISAVQKKRVYKFPLATYRPFAPNLDLGELLLFLAKHNHPQIFKDLDIKGAYKAHFSEFYDIKLTDNELDSILNPSPKAGQLD